MKFNPLHDLLDTGFTIIEIGLFYGDPSLILDLQSLKLVCFMVTIPYFFDKMAMFTLINDNWILQQI